MLDEGFVALDPMLRETLASLGEEPRICVPVIPAQRNADPEELRGALQRIAERVSKLLDGFEVIARLEEGLETLRLCVELANVSRA